MKKVLKVFLASLFVMTMVLSMNVVTAEAAAPAKVTGLKQTEGGTSNVKLTWNAVVGNEIRYVIEFSKDNVTWEQATTSSSTEQPVYSLTAGTRYFVRVKAVSKYYSSNREDGAYSDVIEVVTAPKPSSEQVVQTNATSSSVSVAWNAVPGATAYDVYIYSSAIAAEKVLVGTTAGTSATINNVPASVSYTVYVYPKKTAPTTKFTAVSTSYIYKTGILSAPGKVGVVIMDRDPRKKISGKKNADYNTVDVDYGYALYASGYEVYLFNASGKKIKTIDNTTTTTASLFKGVKTTDTISVQVVPYVLINGVKKYGVPSDKILSVGAPTAKVSKSGSGIKISWNKVPKAKKYEVYMSKERNKGYKKVKTVKGNKKSVVLNKFRGKGFKKYHTYYYYVKAVGNYGGKKNVKSDIFYTNSFWFSTKKVY